MSCQQCRYYLCPECVQHKASSHIQKRRMNSNGDAVASLSPPGLASDSTATPSELVNNSLGSFGPTTLLPGLKPPNSFADLQENLGHMLSTQTSQLQNTLTGIRSDLQEVTHTVEKHEQTLQVHTGQINSHTEEIANLKAELLTMKRSSLTRSASQGNITRNREAFFGGFPKSGPIC